MIDLGIQMKSGERRIGTMSGQNYPTPASLTYPPAVLHMDAAVPNAVASDNLHSALEQSPTTSASSGLTFADLPLEIREMIWKSALPEPRVFNALIWISAGLKMHLLNRSELKMPLAHVCFEARRIVRQSGYVLAFRDEDESDDPGVWFHPRKDRIERTIWGPGDWNTAI